LIEPVRPDYSGAWIGGVIPALTHEQSAAWLPAGVQDAAGVLLLVLDGLGWTMLEQHRDQLPTLGAMAGAPITSVAPSTTAAGLTSISTGAAPSEHGLVGYRIRVAGEALNVLRWQTSNGPDPRTTQPLPPFLGRSVPVVTRAEFRHSGFTEAHLRDQVLIGWRTTSALVEHCRRLATDRHPLIYAYYDGVDKVAHEYGLRSEFIVAELRTTDRLVADLLEALPVDWALVVTADHGQVHVDDDDIVVLDAVAEMVGAYSGEGRFRTLHARSGASADLVAACRDCYGDSAWVFTRDQLFDEGWLGPPPSLAVRGRVGDVVLAAREPVIFLDPEVPLERVMRSHHGSLTPDEMLVPLIAARRSL
jgi:hypothetical protein